MFKIEIENWICPNRAGGSSYSGGEFFREPRRGVPLRAAGAQEGRQPAVFHPLVNLPFSLGESGADCRHVTAAKMGNGSRVTTACLSPPFRSSQIAYCYTDGLLCAGATQGELPEGQERVPWGMTVPHNSLARYDRQGLRR